MQYTKREEHKKKVIAYLYEQARKTRYIKTADIAEAVNLNNHQAGDVMGRLKSEDTPGMRVRRWGPHRHRSTLGSTWEVDLI